MTSPSTPWPAWAKRIKALSQTGLTYARDPFDQGRYKELEHIAHEMIAHLSEATIEETTRFFLPDRGYPTPKTDLRGGVFRDGKILLVRERSDGKWSLPGGWADVNESPTEGIMREIREESGYEAARPRLVAVVDRSLHAYEKQFPFHVYKLFFLCELTGGESCPDIEISETGFFSLDALPELSLERVLPGDLERLERFSKGLESTVYVD